MTEMISILVPTLNRPKSMAAFVKAVDATAVDKASVEVVFGIHADDAPSLQAASDLAGHGVSVKAVTIDRYQDGKAHLSFFWNQLYRKTGAPIVGFFGDDVEFRTPGWDVEVRKEFATDKMIMVSCNDYYIHQGRDATLFFTHREFHDKVGYYMNESFRRWFLDTFWSDVFKKAGKMKFRVDIVTAHYSPDIFKDRLDDTYKDMDCFKGPDHATWQLAGTRQEIDRVVSILKESP